MIQPIVEGHGEVPSVPILIRKLGELMGIRGVRVGSPIRRPRSRLVQQDGIIQAIEVAKIKPGCRAILVMFDADDFCPKESIGDLLAWASKAAKPLDCSVVMPNREYEGWLLASIEVIKYRSLSRPDPYRGDPESKRDAKRAIEVQFGSEFHYLETTDQPSFTAQADWSLVYQRCRSFRKMVKEIARLFQACGWQPAPWPQ